MDWIQQRLSCTLHGFDIGLATHWSHGNKASRSPVKDQGKAGRDIVTRIWVPFRFAWSFLARPEMASFSDLSILGSHTSHVSHGSHGSHTRLTKSRSKSTMKPILKKTSHSEKNSLDLDRGWEEAIHYSNHGWGATSGVAKPNSIRGSESQLARGLGITEAGANGIRGGKDVSFSLSATDLNRGEPGTRKYSHTRSTSVTSHISVATSASGHLGGGRSGSFVHPFQQIPRSSTPPLSYANSLASFDNASFARDYSPTITEDEDADPQNLQKNYYPTHPYPSSLRRPSIASQANNSQTDLAAPPPLRINTSQTTAAPATRLGRSALTSSKSDLRLDALSATQESPISSSVTGCTITQTLTSPVSSVAPTLSPIRSSLEMNFRIRSRSELDTASRQEQIRRARREFEIKEAQKQALRDEKAARRRDAEVEKEAQKFVRKQKQLAKSNGLASGRNSVSAEARPPYSRNNTAGTNELAVDPEKSEFAANNYASTAPGAVPVAEAAQIETQTQPRRSQTARRKTASAWTSFILWVRTKLFKAGRR